MKEIWDIYDVNRIKTGKTVIRGQSLQQGEYHLVVHACIFHPNGKMLIQKRQPFKDGWPNMWDISVGGSALTNETSVIAIKRECLEELGIKLDLEGVRPHLSVQFDHGFDDIYLIEKDVDLDALILQKEEVQCVKWATYDEIIQKIADGTFIPYHQSLIRLCFEMRGHYGCHKNDK